MMTYDQRLVHGHMPWPMVSVGRTNRRLGTILPRHGLAAQQQQHQLVRRALKRHKIQLESPCELEFKEGFSFSERIFG